MKKRICILSGILFITGLFLTSAAIADPGGKLFDSSASCVAPTLNQDGSKLVYPKKDGDGVFQLFIYDLDASAESQLTADGIDHIQAKWLDNDTIVFVKYISPVYQIFKMEATVGATQVALTSDDANHTQPSPNPDGAWVTFLKKDATGYAQVYAMEATSGATQLALTSDPEVHFSPRWSPQSSWAGVNFNKIAFIEADVLASDNVKRKLYTVYFNGAVASDKTLVYDDTDMTSEPPDTTVQNEEKTKGAAGGMDSLTFTPVVSITSVVEGATTYVDGVDYQLTGNTVDWSLGGSEPAPGVHYEVTYVYDPGVQQFDGWNQIYPRWRPDSQAIAWEQFDGVTADYTAPCGGKPKGCYPPGDMQVWVSEYSSPSWQAPTIRTQGDDEDHVRILAATHTGCQNYSPNWALTETGWDLVFEKSIAGYTQIWSCVSTGPISQTAITEVPADGWYQCTAPFSLNEATLDTTPPTFAGITSATHESWTDTAYLGWAAGSDDLSPISYNIYYSTTQTDVFTEGAKVTGVSATETTYTVNGLSPLPQYFGVRCADNPRPIFFGKVDVTGFGQIYFFSGSSHEETNTAVLQSTALPTPTPEPTPTMPPVPTQTTKGTVLLILLMTGFLVAVFGGRYGLGLKTNR